MLPRGRAVYGAVVHCADGDLAATVHARRPSARAEGHWLLPVPRWRDGGVRGAVDRGQRLSLDPLASSHGRWTRGTIDDGHGDGRARHGSRPTGESVLFISDRHEKDAQAFVMRLSGGEARKLPAVAGGVGAAEWSPDGRQGAAAGAVGERRFSVGKPDDPTALAIDSLVWRVNGVGVRDQRNAIWLVNASGRGKPDSCDVRRRRCHRASLAARRPDRVPGRPSPGLLRGAPIARTTITTTGGRPREAERVGRQRLGSRMVSRWTLAMIGVEPDNAFWREPHLFVKRSSREGSRAPRPDLDRPAAARRFRRFEPGRAAVAALVRRQPPVGIRRRPRARLSDTVRARRRRSSGWLEGDVVAGDVHRAATASSRSRTSVPSRPISTSSVPGSEARDD